MKELKNIIFDYQDTIYQNEDPLFFALRNELFLHYGVLFICWIVQKNLF